MADGVVTDRPPHRAGPVSPERVLLIVGIGTFMVFLDTTIVNIAFPDVRADFGDAGLGALSWVLNAYNVVLAAFLVVFGRIADVVGRRRTYVAGIAVFGLASAACAAAPSAGVLIAARVLQGIGGAMIVPAGLALVVRAFPAERRAHGVALWTALAALAASVGPTLGGLLVAAQGWRLTFLVNVPVTLLAIAAARRGLVESRAAGRRTVPDLFGSTLVAVALGAVALGLVKGEDWGWASTELLGCAVVALAAGAVVVARSRRHRAPALDLALLGIRDVALANGLTVTASVTLFGAMLCNVLFLTGVWGYSELQAGLAISPGPLMTAIVAGPAGKVAERRGPRPVVLVGLALWAAGLLFFITRAGTEQHFAAHWLPGILLTGTGMGLVVPTLNGAAVAAAPGTSFGMSAAINAASRQLGGVLGVALLVAVVGTPAPAQLAAAFQDGWRMALAFLVVTAVGTFALRRPRAATGAPPAEIAETEPVPAPPPLPSARAGAGHALHRVGVRGAAAAREAREVLAALALLRGCEPATAADLAAAAEPVELAAGARLFEAGDPADAVFVVVSGRLAAVAADDGGRPLWPLARGDLIGEVAVLAGTPRSAGIVALRDSRLLRIPAAVLLGAAERDAALAGGLVRTLGARLTADRGRVFPGGVAPSTVAVLPASEGAPAEPVAAALAEQLTRLGSVAVLEARDGVAGADHPALAEALEEAEVAHDRVLLCGHTDDPADPWTAFCLGQADRVVVVADGPQAPGWAPAEGCELVWTGAGREGLAALGGALGARAVCITEAGDPAVDAVARRLAGASVGLVLGGGGARALAHIGVLDELAAAGVEIDRIAGVGTGALIGALHAAGMDSEEIHGWCYEWLVRGRALSRLGRPRHGILRDDRLAAALRDAFGDQLIEELPRQLRCGCADFLGREAVVLRTGRVAEAVRATLGLPGLLAPTVVGDRLLVDGGMLDNLPLAALDAGDGPLVVVDVGPSHARARPPDEQLPRITETLQRALLLGGADGRAAAHAVADVLVLAQVEDFGALEYHLVDELREAGREAAREALAGTATQGPIALAGSVSSTDS